MTKAEFAAHSITISGTTFPTEYSISPSGTVFAFVEVIEDDKPVKLRIRIDAADQNYSAALAAAKQERTEREPAAPTLISTLEDDMRIACQPIEPEQIPEGYTARATTAGNVIMVERHIDITEPEQTASEPEQTATESEQTASGSEQTASESEQTATESEQTSSELPAHNPKQARGIVPEKTFIGLEIKGNGWKIYFDPAYDRTRVIFPRKPSTTALEAVKTAGFFWSPAMKSWNKKLTHKAFRAAQALADQLRTICR